MFYYGFNDVDTWTNLKVMYDGKYGLTGGACRSITFINPGFYQFRTANNTGINLNVEKMTIIGGVFWGGDSIIGNMSVGVNASGGSGSADLILTASKFVGVTLPIHLWYCAATLTGNEYLATPAGPETTTILSYGGAYYPIRAYNDQFVSEATGVGTITGSTYAIITHGMSAGALSIYCIFNNTDFGEYTTLVSDGTTFNVYVTVSGDYTFRWVAFTYWQL